MATLIFTHTSILDPSALSDDANMNLHAMLMDPPLSFNTPIYELEDFSNRYRCVMVNSISISSNDPMKNEWEDTSNLNFSCSVPNSVGA